ncbi:hypothetical protein D3C76_1190640 [compost metagenome]
MIAVPRAAATGDEQRVLVVDHPVAHFRPDVPGQRGAVAEVAVEHALVAGEVVGVVGAHARAVDVEVRVVLAVVEVAQARIDVVDVRHIQRDIVADLPVVARVVVQFLAGAAAEAEVDVGTPDPEVQPAGMHQGGRTLDGRVVLRLRDAAGAVVAEQAGFQRQAEVVVELDGLGRRPGRQQAAGECEGDAAFHRKSPLLL